MLQNELENGYPSTSTADAAARFPGYVLDALPLSNAAAQYAPDGLKARRLIYHYVNAIVPDVPEGCFPEHQNLWDVAIRRQGVLHDHVVYGVLSLAATHLATHTPENRRYHIAEALHFQNAALTKMAAITTNITEENCEAVLTSSALVISCSFALPIAITQVYESSLDPIKEISQIMRLVRGGTTIFRMGWRAALDNNTSAVLRQSIVHMISQPDPSSPESDSSLNRAALKVQECIHDERRRRIYLGTIRTLKQNIRRATRWPMAHRIIAALPGNAPKVFIADMESYEPIPLILLAHWAVELHWARAYWWLRDWGVRLVELVRSALDPEWQEYIRWPLREVGLLSPTYTEVPMPTPDELLVVTPTDKMTKRELAKKLDSRRSSSANAGTT